MLLPPCRGRWSRAIVGLLGAAASLPVVLHAQRPSLPPPSLTGPNGAYLHDAWHGGQGDLPEASALSVAEDPGGFLVMALTRGVYRFDGRGFHALRFSRPASGELLLVGRGDSVWLAGAEGLRVGIPGKDARRVGIDGDTVSHVPISAIGATRDGTIYVGIIDAGLAVVHGAQSHIVRRGAAPEQFARDSAGGMWFVAADGIHRIHPESTDARPDLWDPRELGGPTAIAFERSGALWIAGRDRIVRFSDPTATGGGDRRTFPFAQVGVVGGVSAIVVSRRGDVWVGTRGGGVVRLFDGRAQNLGAEEGLSDNAVNALWEDHEGNLWVATQGGIDRLRPRAIRAITARNGLRDNDVWSVGVAPDGRILVGTRRGGLQWLTADGATPARDATGRPIESWANVLRFDQRGGAWIGAFGDGIAYLAPDGTLQRNDAIPHAGELRSIASSLVVGDTLWLGSSLTDTANALHRRVGAEWRRYKDRRAPGMRRGIWSLARDASGALWAGADHLYRLEGDSLRRVCDLPADEISYVLPDGDAVWFTSYDKARLAVYSGGACHLVRGPGAPVEGNYGIWKDATGGLWLANGDGLWRFDAAQLLQRALDPKAPLRGRRFDQLDGLPTLEFNSGGDSHLAVTSRGELLLASAGGLIVVDPAAMPPSLPAPRAAVLGVRVNDATYDGGRALRLPLGNGSLAFTFTAPALGRPQRLRLQFRLDGVDAGWIDAGDRREASYSHVGGGARRFHVRAAGDEGEWGEETSVALDLEAPFTRTPLFYAIAALTLLGSGLGVGQLRSEQLARRERRLARLVDERTRELAHARDRLEERVAERTRALAQESAERLKVEQELHEAQRMESVGRLAGGIAHDLNNMLQVILGHAGLLRNALRQTSHAAELEHINAAGDRAAHLTRQLLTFARRQVGRPRVVPLNDVVRQVTPMLERVLGPNVALALELDPSLHAVYADPAQLEMVLVNLTMNARDAMPDGGRLVVRTTNRHFDAEAALLRAGREAGDWVQLSVADSGVGIPPEILQHIFEPFYTTKDVGKGTGLGLASCYGVARQWGGHISASSAVGEGTIVELLLPRAQQDGSASGEPTVTPPTVERGAGATVMLVEDLPELRDITRRMLQAIGYRVVEASDGQEAIAMMEIRGETADLVLTDLVMPRMGGKALAEHLARTNPTLPVVLMTGYARDMLAANGLLDSSLPLLTKPFDLAQLAETLAETLRGGAEPSSTDGA